MKWVIKHKSGRTLFVTSDEFIANNRREMGWIVGEVKMTSREQFEKWLYQQRVRGITFSTIDKFDVDGEVYYKSPDIQGQWNAWQASRAAIEIAGPDFIDSRSALNNGYTVDYSNGFGDAMDAYELAIEQAGLEVKK